MSSEPTQSASKQDAVPSGSLWLEIDADLRRLVHSRRISELCAGLGVVDLDDLRQLAALHVIERIAKQPGFRKVLEERTVRQAYLVATLYNYARTLSRRARTRLSILKKASHLLEESVAQPEDQDLYEICAKLLEQVSIEGEAKLALDVIVGNTTLPDYASDQKLSLRTAQRRFLVGMESLRELAKTLAR